ncbi:elongation factor P hydroxylase [Salinicola acroporae]|uniref:Transporting ATPase n=1 Tax=Salinicola acroporae TaxID=1541440 RepID=A0ABT6I735_9GAMM|nr:elongation factor P hydroxylase [Salinicola acroporae]MDH4573481.1 transporting ATPase [Salinicola acroporae]
MTHDIEDLIALFDGIFTDSYRTRLVRGENEPIYLPADACHEHHRIVFAHGFFASALHEISHWCIAGAARRQLEDYGYWYEPDGRDAERQADFERVETAPQALESLLSAACGKPFEVSIDNLDGVEVDRWAFSAKVAARVARYRREGIPRRAQALIDALAIFYREEAGLQAAIAAGRRRLEMGASMRRAGRDADGDRA